MTSSVAWGRKRGALLTLVPVANLVLFFAPTRNAEDAVVDVDADGPPGPSDEDLRSRSKRELRLPVKINVHVAVGFVMLAWAVSMVQGVVAHRVVTSSPTQGGSVMDPVAAVLFCLIGTLFDIAIARRGSSSVVIATSWNAGREKRDRFES